MFPCELLLYEQMTVFKCVHGARLSYREPFTIYMRIHSDKDQRRAGGYDNK